MPETKPSNPKDALGIKKAPLHAVPCQPLYEVGLAMMEGGRKYGTHNYRSVGVRASVYYDAAMRHLMAWWEGEDNDPDSGISHLAKAMACLFVYRDSELLGNAEDDRPIRHPDKLDLSKFNKLAADIITKHPKCVKPFLHHSVPDMPGFPNLPAPTPTPQPGEWRVRRSSAHCDMWLIADGALSKSTKAYMTLVGGTLVRDDHTYESPYYDVIEFDTYTMAQAVLDAHLAKQKVKQPTPVLDAYLAKQRQPITDPARLLGPGKETHDA